MPDNLNVTVVQYNNGYWNEGECELIQVNFIYDNKKVASAPVNADTAELVKEIMTYSE